MPSADIFRLLLTAASADEANHFVSILRSANYTVDAKLATQEHELQPLLARDWDLVLTLESHTLLAPKLVRQNLLRAERDTPFIVVSELDNQQSVIDGLRLGAAAVVARDHDQHLLLAVERSQRQAAMQRQLQHSDRQLQQLQRQHRTLLNSWPAPLLVVVEGIVRLCNGAAARMLDSEPSALLELPILDSLDTRSRNQLRRHLLAGGEQSDSVDIESLNFVTAGGAVTTRRVAISVILFGGERALQVAVEARLRRDGGSVAQRRPELAARPEQAAAAIERGLRRSGESGRPGALIKLQITDYPALLERLGSHTGAQLLEQLLRRVGDSVADAAELIICGPGSATLTLLDCDENYALARAEALWAAVNGEPFGDQSVRVQVGVTALHGRINSVDEAQAQCAEALKLSAANGAAALFSTAGRGAEESTIVIDELIEDRKLAILYRPLTALAGSPRALFSSELASAEGAATTVALLDQLHASGQRQRLDHWLIVSALAELHSAGDRAPALLLPLSAASVTDNRFIPWLKAQLRSHPLANQTLTIALRESDVIRHLERVAATADQLAELGIALAISHFGVALNPLETLTTLRPSLLVLDRQISAELAGEGGDSALALLEAIGELGLPTVVDGVDSAQSLPALWRAGIHYISGSYIGAAQPSLGG